MKQRIKDLHRKGKAVYSAKSSSGDKFYEIWKAPDGSLSCECMGFTMRRTCRHLQEYLERQMKHKGGG